MEGTPDNLFSSIFIFTQQSTINSLQADTIYLLKLRASTIGIMGQSLFGPDILLRVQNGEICVCMAVGKGGGGGGGGAGGAFWRG